LIIEVHWETRYPAWEQHKLPTGEIMSSQTPLPPDRATPPSMPRWVKVFGIILLMLVIVVIILHLTGNNPGGHIPHMP
jgi:hypothetical protein